MEPEANAPRPRSVGAAASHAATVDLARIHEDRLRPGGKFSAGYFALLGALAAILLAGAVAFSVQAFSGLWVTGLQNPVGWGIYITSFVFWVGIAHSGTLISAILLLFRARWRPAISRFAEAMTLFAVMTAGLFPLVHLGRVWKFYYLLPYPNQRGLWPNFRSPLIWDVFAVTTYLTVSACFLYLGLIPDLAALRDRSTGWKRTAYGALSLGWQGTGRQWHHFKALYLFFAALATPLVISVHSVVSWDFAVSIVPGWHSTIFPPYFVAGAIPSGLAMVLSLSIPMRGWLGLDEYINKRHLDGVAKLLLFVSLIVTYSYIVEFFMAWYSGEHAEQAVFQARVLGRYAPLFAVMLVGNCIAPLTLFSARARQSVRWLWILSILVNLGMWSERYWIITSSLGREYDPAAWGWYTGSLVEVAVFFGSFAMFLLLFLIFVRLVPPVPLAEVKEDALHHGGLA